MDQCSHLTTVHLTLSSSSAATSLHPTVRQRKTVEQAHPNADNVPPHSSSAQYLSYNLRLINICCAGNICHGHFFRYWNGWKNMMALHTLDASRLMQYCVFFGCWWAFFYKFVFFSLDIINFDDQYNRGYTHICWRVLSCSYSGTCSQRNENSTNKCAQLNGSGMLLCFYNKIL